MHQFEERIKRYLFVSDFDHTLSFNDSGFVLSDLLGIDRFKERIAGLSEINLVQQGGELAYLLLHDPEFSPRSQGASRGSGQAHSPEGKH
jgi:hypothetical protein